MPLIAPPFDQPGDLRAEIDDVIVRAIVNDDRSLQKTLGPSEMGCPRCIARHFMGIEKLPETQAHTPEAVPWLPWLGTAFHAQMESVFETENARLAAAGHPERYLIENRVPVGIIDGRYISGSSDLFDLWTLTNVDWKLVGTTKMNAVRRKGDPGTTYRNQAHVYGRGYHLLGIPCERVAIYFLPRNAIRLSQGFFWSEPYNAELAERVVQRVVNIAETVRLARPVQYNEILVRLDADPDCFSCDEYPPLPGVTEQLSKKGTPKHAAFDQPTSFSDR